MKDSWYIPKQEAYGMATLGYLVECDKCKRKMSVVMGVNGSNHNTKPSVTCADCLVVSEEWAKAHPEIAAQIAEWKAAL